MKFIAVLVMMFALFGAPVMAVSEDFENLDPECWVAESITGQGVAVYFGDVPVVTERTEFRLKDDCAGGNEIEYTQPINLTLGAIQEDEVIITDDSVYVDSALRPDLDQPARLIFRNQPFAVQPSVLRDDTSCLPPDCNIESYSTTGELRVNVSGFSNYTLQGRQDFTVYSDEEPELQGKIYQVLDLGNTHRGTEFKCQVMIFAENADAELVLVQTNPEREVQGKILGNPDSNQPESLGYFPSENGVANVYFRNDLLVGYTDFQYVAQCQSNTTQLVYEETIRPVNSPLGRNFAGRAVWLTTDNDGQNSFFLVLYFIGAIIGIALLLMFYYRVVRRR